MLVVVFEGVEPAQLLFVVQECFVLKSFEFVPLLLHVVFILLLRHPV